MTSNDFHIEYPGRISPLINYWLTPSNTKLTCKVLYDLDILSKNIKDLRQDKGQRSNRSDSRYNRVFFKNGVVQHMSGEDRYM